MPHPPAAGAHLLSPRCRDDLPYHPVRNSCDPAGLTHRNAGHPHIVKYLIPHFRFEALELRHIAATGEPLHYICGPLIV